MAKKSISQVIRQANQEGWSSGDIYAVYCTAWSGGPMKKESAKVQLIGSYDECVAMVDSTPYSTMPLSMVDLEEGYGVRNNFNS